MFALRATVASLTMFMLVMGVCWVVVAAGWRSAAMLAAKTSPRRLARLLFILRMMPVVIPAVVVGAITLPAFLRFEPRVVDEPLTAPALTLSVLALVLAVVAVARASRTYASAEKWARAAVSGACRTSPAVALAGVGRGTVLVSPEVKAALTETELQSAIAHEGAHARSRDNLKKLFVHACALPGLKSLDEAWLEAIEFAADDDAVRNEGEALALASALVKVARLQSAASTPILVSCFADAKRSLVQRRVERLLGERAAPRRSRRGVLAAAFTSIALAAAVFYPSILAAAHQLTELILS